jgi:apolipoprotein D and lipocalin family protein
MKTKLLGAICSLFVSSVALGNTPGVWADGYVTYKHPNGKLVNRECAMFVPAMGIGEVKLKCGEFSTSTSEFSTRQVNGQSIFSVLFRDMNGAPAGTVAKYQGSYLRGSNQAIYYGDVFSSSDSQAKLDSEGGWTYAGGFMFSKEIGGGHVKAEFKAETTAEVEAEAGPVRVVDYVDLNRYLGKWYEIASFPQSFQKGCVGTTAQYSQKPNGRISVLNECRIGTLDGSIKTATGTARVVDRETNAKLKVTFFWPFSGNYWILDLDPDYQWAVVGDPSREYLWILSRNPQLDPALYEDILGRLRTEQAYDVSRLVRTLQPSTITP